MNGVQKAGSFSELKKLSLRYHRIRSTGATHLASVLPYTPKLHFIDLRNNKITESGAVAIAYFLEKCKGAVGPSTFFGDRRPKNLIIKLQENPIGTAVQQVLF